MGGVKSRMKAFLNKILLQIWNAEDEGKKIFIDSEELGKPIGNGEKYYHWAEKQRALPEEKPSDWFATQKEIYEQEENSVPNAEREELIQRLKAMAEEEVLPPGQRPWGAMCYSPAAPNMTYTFTCPRCGRIVKELDYDSRYELHKIASMVNEMKQLGYDVKIERVCSICSGSSGKHPLEVDTLFYFRFKGMEAYHVVVANNLQAYKIALAFLRSENAYYGDRDELEYVSEHRDVIEEMLGIKI